MAAVRAPWALGLRAVLLVSTGHRNQCTPTIGLYILYYFPERALDITPGVVCLPINDAECCASAFGLDISQALFVDCACFLAIVQDSCSGNGISLQTGFLDADNEGLCLPAKSALEAKCATGCICLSQLTGAAFRSCTA